MHRVYCCLVFFFLFQLYICFLSFLSMIVYLEAEAVISPSNLTLKQASHFLLSSQLSSVNY